MLYEEFPISDVNFLYHCNLWFKLILFLVYIILNLVVFVLQYILISHKNDGVKPCRFCPIIYFKNAKVTR